MCFSVKHDTLSSLPSHNVWNSNTLAQHSVIFSDGGRSPSVNKLRCEIPVKTKRETRKSAKVYDLIRLTPIKSFVTYVSFPHATTLPVCPPQAQLTRNPGFGTRPPRTPLTDDARPSFLLTAVAGRWPRSPPNPPNPERRPARFSGKQGGGEDSLASYREIQSQRASPGRFSTGSAFNSLRERGKVSTRANQVLK